MRSERRTRTWWRDAVARWKRSGLSAQSFAEREGLSARTLSWWSSTLRRDTRAERGSDRKPVTAIEIALPPASAARHIEIAIGGAVVRVEVGSDVDYVVE